MVIAILSHLVEVVWEKAKPFAILQMEPKLGYFEVGVILFLECFHLHEIGGLKRFLLFTPADLIGAHVHRLFTIFES
jgi:hypothetical protein